MSAPAPCEGCLKAPRCQAESLACDALVLYKRVGGGPERWGCAPRFPTAELFARANEPVKAWVRKSARPVMVEDDYEE